MDQTLEQRVEDVARLQSQEEVFDQYKDILYQTSNGKVGQTAFMLQKSGPFGRSCTFSNHLARAGNYVNNGLNTVVDRERYIDQSKDWMLKN
jgi:hypothetical protein